jgi:hypothetical protein
MTEAKKPDGNELADDVLGFARLELHTVKDLVLRPAVVLQVMMERGPNGGGAYTRPLRLYLILCAFLMLILFLQGGADYLLTGLPPEMINALVERSGKSMDAFMADADGWMSLVMVPILSTFYALLSVPFFRLWDREDLGWRRGLRSTFCWLNAWTVLILPLSWWVYGTGPLAAILSALIFLLGIIAFLRMGRGRWFHSTFMGVLKAILLMIIIQIAGAIGMLLVSGIGILGAVFTS